MEALTGIHVAPLSHGQSIHDGSMTKPLALPLVLVGINNSSHGTQPVGKVHTRVAKPALSYACMNGIHAIQQASTTSKLYIMLQCKL